MIQFQKLRLQGFKSFADKTELDIGAGLNGVVGPNGCGKSNLVEALRWVMGEGSARKMRGDGMEDVIFAGTASRAGRNIAEVSLLLDNSSRKAPAAYNGQDEIEITRRIERDHGSVYKINGKTVRARDVQMLLADTMTGASSPALVSQGRITQIISAKPLERRLILEESAGISGLYARRHEAELRLKAADANLQRVSDVTGGMEGRLVALKRQARQASRYRNLSAQLRQIDIIIAWLEWRGLEEKRKSQENAFHQAESIVAEKMVSVTQLSKTQLVQAEELPALRRAEAEAAASLQTKKIALQRAEEEEARIKAAIEEVKGQLTQTLKDKEHEALTLSESSKTLESILAEQSALLSLESGESERLQTLEKQKQELEAKVSAYETDYTALMQLAAEARAMRQSLSEQIARAEDRLQGLGSRKEHAEKEKAALLENSTLADLTAKAEHSIKTLQDKIKALQDKKAASAKALEDMEGEITTARHEAQEAQKSLSAFVSELSVLEKIVAGAIDKEFQPVLQGLKTEPGFEKALSRALGDSLMASLDVLAPSFWRKSGAGIKLPDLPQGLAPLAPKIMADAVLGPALSQIGFVEDPSSASAFLDALLPGQAIVSLAGDYWRWDGFSMKAAAQDHTARLLEQKNKLETLRATRQEIENRASNSAARLQTLLTNEKTLKTQDQEDSQSLSAHQRDLQTLERETARLREEKIRQTSALERLEEIIKSALQESAEIIAALEKDRSALAALNPESDTTETAKTEALRARLLEARSAHQDALRCYERFLQEQNSRKARLQAIGDERINLQNRVIRSREQLKAYEARTSELQTKTSELLEKPSQFEAQKETLLNEISAREQDRDQAAQRLSIVEGEVSETTRALKEAERILGEARESRASAQATLGGLKEQSDTLSASIAEKFDLRPSELISHLSQDPSSLSQQDLSRFRRDREELSRERESIGPVNLRADTETQELEAELATLLKEQSELTQAAQELRGAIQKINKEARERLLAAFELINAHFQTLFTRLFQGGQASLSLIDSDDPLGAGLEIFAQPPGKSLQSLSLLSGGEQTMTSIALIFAMFLTNPSPICVLDEIDAPLDDSNVDRVCDLLDEIAERGETRFLVITHHRLSMARMDRLYGVTMAEKGISQLVSVDLQQSFDFVKEAA